MSETFFSGREWLRYTRHIQLPQIGVAGQQRLSRAKVLVIGAGGLGSPVLLYLAAAGVGQITIIDGDEVDLTNLQRQIIFSSDQIGQPKAQAAQQRLCALNPDIEVLAVNECLSKNNIQKFIEDKNLVIDCTDNFATRYLINDSCGDFGIPWLFASIFQFSGQCALFTPQSACFRCLFPQFPTNMQDCNNAGVLGVLPGLLGTLQANEAIKYLTGLETPLDNHLLLVEAMDLSFRRIQLAKSTSCPQCNQHLAIPEVSNSSLYCDNQQSLADTITATQWQQIITHEDRGYYRILDVRGEAERAAFHLGGELMPLDQLNEYLTDFHRDQMLLCYCQSGARSLKAVELLKENGLKAKSIRGGIVEMLQVSLKN